MTERPTSDEPFASCHDSVAHLETGDTWWEGFARRGLGLLLEEAGDHEAAGEHFESALEIFGATGHRRGRAMAMLSPGKAARARGKTEKAVAELTRALETFEEIDDLWSIARGKLHLAPVLVESGRGGRGGSSRRGGPGCLQAIR